MPKPVIASISNWMHSSEDIGSDKTSAMVELANM